MIIEDLSAIQEWLTSVLRPLCDADPEALGKYVLALLKKEMAEEELRRSMSEQLDIFLQEKTQPFIDRLFERIHTNEYNAMTTNKSTLDGDTANGNSADVVSNGQPSDESINTTDQSVNAETSGSSICVEDKPDAAEQPTVLCDKVETNSALNIEIQNNSMSSDGTASSEAESSGTESKKSRKRKGPLKVVSNWREKRSLSRSSDSSPGSNKKPYTSYSRRPLRPQVLRNRQRSNWSPVRRRTRRDVGVRRLMRSPVLRNKSISPAPMKRLVPLSHKRSSFSRSMSRSLSPRKTKRLSSKVEGRAPTPDNDSLLDNINTKCSVKSKVVKPDAREQPTSDEKLRNTRCRDFDEKGLCLRGELCPYDHGTDPFVLEDVVGRNVPVPASVAQNNFGPKQLAPSDKHMTSFMNVFNPLRHPHPGNGEYYPESPGILPHFGWNAQVRPRHQFRPRHLNFDAAPFSGRGGPPHPSLMRPYGFHMPRQLVTIPVDGSAQPSPGPLFGEPPFPGGPWMCRGVFGTRGRGRGMFDFRRLGVRSGKQMGNCCLEVRKIPQDLNKIEALINHFSRFGNVVSIQTNWDNDPEGALVTFSNQDEAHQAYRSSDAVLNNRFIRVFWYNKEKDQSKGNQQHEFEFSHTSEPQSKSKSKYLSEQPYQAGLPSFIPVKDTNASAGGAPLDQAITDRPNEVVKDDEPVDVDSTPVLQPLEPLLETPKKPQNDSYSADLLKTRDSMMRLMTTQIEEQKKLILHLETNRDRMNPKQIEDYMGLIGSLQKSCGELGRNLAVVNSNLAQNSSSNNNGNPTTNPKICSKEEISRKILDAELELYALERNGQETSEIEKKILKLRDEELSFISGS